jgi:tRNA A-37 threonylcarbamoyl transferase component Bud32
MSGSLPILAELPTGYFVDESPGGVLALHVDHARALHEAGYGPEQDGALARSELSGRRPMLELEAGGESLVVRRFSHGGLARWLTGERYLDPERPFRELILSDSLRRAGIPSPLVVAARARPAGLLGWRLDLVTRRIEDSLDLGHALRLARAGEVPPAARGRLARALGALVRRLHRHGCLHADLTPTNVLCRRAALRGEDSELWVIDLDRSVLVERPTEAERLRNLRRLHRYVERRERRLGPALSRSDLARFLVAYEPDRDERRRVARGILEAHRRSRLVHAVGWFFEGLFWRGVDPREAPAAPGGAAGETPGA